MLNIIQTQTKVLLQEVTMSHKSDILHMHMHCTHIWIVTGQPPISVPSLLLNLYNFILVHILWQAKSFKTLGVARALGTNDIML